MPTEYPTDFKQKVMKRYQNGEFIKSLSHELHIAQRTLYRWRKEYCAIQGTTHTYTPKEFDAISRRLTKLEHEMEIIRFSQCIANGPLQKRLSILENLHHQSDNITYFKVNDYWLYLCIILDLFSRKIVGHRVSRNASTNLVTSTFRAAFCERGNPADLTFHSDRGKQYTSAAFTTLLQKCGVKQSFSATARPHDNAVAEAFFASFKREEAYRREYTSEQSFRKSVEKYVQFYNEVRPHRTLRYKTPQAFEVAYHEKTCEKIVFK